MKATLVAALFFLTSLAAFAAPEAPAPGDPGPVSRWFAALGPRREGSAAEGRVFQALEAWFAARTAIQTGDFQGLDEEHSFSRRLWFRVEGKRPGELVVVAPTDGRNHTGLAWAAAWADAALSQGTPVSLTFLFTGAERGEGAAASLGSRTFLQDFYPTAPAAVVYLDVDDRSPGVRFTTESGIFPSPLWMVQGLADAFQARGLTPALAGSAPSLFRLDLPERRNLLAPWFQRAIPALWVSEGPPVPSVVRAFGDFVASLTAGVPDRWDRHYLVFDFGSWKVFWDQRTYLVIFLSVTAVLLFGYAVLGRRRGSLKVLGSGFWQGPVLLAFLFLALGAGTAAVSALETYRGFPGLWRQAPLAVGGFKVLVTVSLYLALFLPFRRSPLVRDPDFYGQASLVWLGALVVAAAALELSFSFYFLWALVWAAVLVVVPWRPVKLAALAAGPLWLFKAAYDVLGPQPDLALARWALVSPLAGNFVLTVLFFPFLLQVNAWHFSGQGRQDRNEGLRAGIQLTLWALATGAAALLVLDLPTGTPPGPASSEASTAETIDLPSQTRVHEPGARPLPYLAGLWKTMVVQSPFLDRAVWDIRFNGPQAPEQVDFTLVGDGPLTVFECSFPVILDPEGTRARIVVGRQPPLPLDLRLTLPGKTRARLEVHARLGPGSEGAGPPLVREITDVVDLSP